MRNKIHTTSCFIEQLRELNSTFGTMQKDACENYEMGLTTFAEKTAQLFDICARYFIELDTLVTRAMTELQVNRDYLEGAANSHCMTLSTIAVMEKAG